MQYRKVKLEDGGYVFARVSLDDNGVINHVSVVEDELDDVIETTANNLPVLNESDLSLPIS